jgi:acetolactate synthase-1/3 small subunit
MLIERPWALPKTNSLVHNCRPYPVQELLMRHVISALVMNEPGVLASVAGLFSARGFNIDSLVVGRTENPELSRMTVVANGDENTLEQIRKQLAKLVPVVKVRDFKGTAYIERDLALITVAVTPEQRGEVIEIVNLFRGRVVDVAKQSVMVEIAGTEEKIEALIELMRPYGIRELARTGVIAMARGTQVAKDEAADKTGGKRKRSLDAPAAQALPPS